MTLREIFDEMHKIDAGLAHDWLSFLIQKLGRDYPQVKEIFGDSE